MYFSTNSRYVLHRAQCLTPPALILKGAERLLSIKIPNDDPSKPPLRVNIPKDASHSDSRSKLIHNATNSGKAFTEPRSRSLVLRSNNPSLGSPFRDGIPSKCGSESQLLQLEAEDLLESDIIKEPTARFSESYITQTSSPAADREGCSFASKKEDEYQEGLKTPLNDPATGEALASNYVNNSAFKSTGQEGSEQTSTGAIQSDASATNQNQRMLYIIIDPPEESEEKHQYKSVADSYKEEGKTPSALTQDDFAAVKALPQKVPTAKPTQTKSGRQKPDNWLSRKSKSVPKFSTPRPDGRHSGRKLDVQEIEDVATYVLHANQHKGITNKSFGVKCVPEKEVTTRSESLNYNEVPIKVPGGGSSKSFKGLSNEMAPVEELPEFIKPSESKRKQKCRDPWGQREERSKTVAKTKNSSSAPFPTHPVVDKSKASARLAPRYPSLETDFPNPRDTQEYLQKPADPASEKGKDFRALTRDSFETGRSAVKSTALKTSDQVSKTKEGSSISAEPAVHAETAARTEFQAEVPASYSHPAEEAKPEYNLVKVETEPTDIEPSRNEYFSPWKDNSNYHPEEPKDSVLNLKDWVQPKPSPPAETTNTRDSKRSFKRPSKKPGKFVNSNTAQEETDPQSSKPTKSERSDSDGSDFRPSASYVSIGCDKVSALPMKFSAAFPPLLCEALKIRSRMLGFRREFLFNDRWTERFEYAGKHLDTGPKSPQKSNMDLSENSILFPKAETDKIEYSLFGKKEEVTLNTGKGPDKDKSPKISDNMANVANETLTEIKGQTSVDSLDMMKKVKKIVEFDLENAIKIFKKEEPGETPSVMMLEGDKWKVDTDELERCIRMRKGQPAEFEDMSPVKKIAHQENVFGDEKINRKIYDFPKNGPIYLPPMKESEGHMHVSEQSDSVVAFNPHTNEFYLNKEDLANAIRRRADDFSDDVVIQTLKGRLTKGAKNESIVVFKAKDGLTYEMRSGDSILVFDEETQSWKVDYSILEKREEQLRMEEELTKRSELILETFEKLEKGNVTKIPMPDTKEKKIFDYGTEEWRVYPTEKKSSEKPSKSKYPFKEANAEEIRRNNSDLYENLFVGNKKETSMNKNTGKPQSNNGSKSCSPKQKKLASGSGSQKESGMSGTSKESGSSQQQSNLPPEGRGGGNVSELKKEDDNFWESFLKMNILPRDISEIRPPPPPPPPPPPKPTSPPPPLQAPKTEIPLSKTPSPKKDSPGPTILPNKIEDPKPTITPKKIEEPKPSVPPKKIDDQPSFIRYIPFIGDRRTDESSIKEPPKEVPKVEDPKKKPPASGGVSKEDSKVKAPPPSTGASKEDSKVKAPPSSTGASKEDSKVKAPPPSTGASKEDSKAKAPPSSTGAKKEDSKVKAPPPSTGASKDSKTKATSPNIDGASKESGKTKELITTTGGITKEDGKVVPPPNCETDPKEDDKVKPPPPTTGDPCKEGSKAKEPMVGITKEDVKKKPSLEAPKSTPEKKSPEAPSTAAGDSKQDSKVKVPAIPNHPKEDPKNTKSPTIGSSSSSFKREMKAPPFSARPKIQEPQPSGGGKRDKSAADHYVSENIIQLSRTPVKDAPAKLKTNKIETVKLNITSEKRMPSKVTEINLNRKCEEKGKESNTAMKKSTPDVTSKNKEKGKLENQTFYRNFEKYKTPFSDPEYEEKSMKIKSDIESNPNLKKLDNWNKTLVLQDMGKSPESVETWLKDETDKMATLLLKVLQEAAEGKPRKKLPPSKLKPGDKSPPKTASSDSALKKCENTPENFLFRVRTVNLSLENEKKLKPAEDRKHHPKPTPLREGAVHLEKAGESPYKVIDATKLFTVKDVQQLSTPPAVKSDRDLTYPEVHKPRLEHTALQSVEPSGVSRDLTNQEIFPPEVTEEVPGPELLKKLSNTWKMFPIIGSQMTIFTLLRAYQLVNLKNSFFSGSNTQKTRADVFAKLFTKYGPIVNVQGPLSGNVILIHKPKHFTSVFEQDAFMSIRSVFDSLEQSRRETEDKVLSAAISTDWSKPEWNDLRRGSNDPLLKGFERFLEPAEVAGDSLICNIRKSRNLQNYVSEDFMEEIKRWSLEGMCNIIFEKSFGFLDRKNTNMSWIMEPDKLFMAVEEASSCLNKCEKGFQLWRLLNTGSVLGLGQAYRSLSTILSKQLYQAEMNLKSKNELVKEQSPLMMEDLTFLESMLLNDGMTTDEVICNLVDIMLLGTNMMNSALGFLLYNLAQNVKVQNKLLKELKTALPRKGSRLDYNTLDSMKYLQACLKESLRLHVPIPIFSRLLQHDILLSNYIIPKGTYVVMDYRVTSMKEQIFDDPEKFVPERWLNDEKWMNDLHPFDTFPLCHGPRAELAKKVVEMQLLACVAKVVRNFGIEYHYGEIEGTNTLISFPGKPLKLNFVERDS